MFSPAVFLPALFRREHYPSSAFSPRSASFLPLMALPLYISLYLIPPFALPLKQENVCPTATDDALTNRKNLPLAIPSRHAFTTGTTAFDVFLPYSTSTG